MSLSGWTAAGTHLVERFIAYERPSVCIMQVSARVHVFAP